MELVVQEPPAAAKVMVIAILVHATDIKEDIKSFNYGIQGAAGFSFDLESGSLRILAGGNYGLTSIQKDTANGNDHTGAVTVTVGYLFNL